MGFFSWKCAVCGLPILNGHAVAGILAARPLSQVCLFAGLTRIVGTYDGYGRIEHDAGIHEIDLNGDEPCLVHQVCLSRAEQRTESEYDPGQGFFYSDEQIRNFVKQLLETATGLRTRQTLLLNGYSEEQLQSAFKRVEDPDDWKESIDAVVLNETDEMLSCIKYAVEFYTGSKCVLTDIDGVQDEKITRATKVESVGYRNGPAGP